MSSIEYEFFMSQVQFIREIRKTDKVEISLVYHEGMQAPCVLKVCKNRDLSEICKVLKELRHPNIVTVFEYIYANSNTYIVEEFIVGKTLQEMLNEKGVFSEKEVIQIVHSVCDGLGVLHKRKPPLVHNDIKTSNIIMREDGTVKLIDFDVSRVYREGASKNTRLFGTEEYASPEHFGFGQSEPCSDVYSLGVTMHELLTGKGLTNDRKMIYKGRLKKIIQKCIEVDRKNRCASACELKNEIKGLSKKRNFFIFSCIILLVLIVFFFITLNNNGEEELQEQQNIEDNLTEELFFNLTEKEISNEDSLLYADTEMISQSKNNEALDSGTQITEYMTEVVVEEIDETNELIKERIMEVRFNVEGEIYDISECADGSLIILEKINKDYYLKTLDGTVSKLENVYGEYGCGLSYNSFTETLYLFEYNYLYTDIYIVEDTLSLINVKKLENDTRPGTTTTCGFFSDGMVICKTLDKGLYNSENWNVVGWYMGSEYVIKDKIFEMHYDFDEYRYDSFVEVDMEGEILNSYDIEEEFTCEFQSGGYIYINGEALYFMGTKDKKDYVYRFDGEKLEIVACLNDYKYYTSSTFWNLCVTEDYIYGFDNANKCIKEFKIK